MDYKVLKKDSPGYPKRFHERPGAEAPTELYCHGPLGHLKHFTMAVISADSISGLAMMAANQALFTIREYAMNYIGGWHSVMETEIFRLGLFRKGVHVTLFSAKGLGKETFESFLNDRFCPPLHEFPERGEYDRRAREGELLILSLTPPSEGRTLRKNVMARNWVACALADVVFVPFAARGTKTLAIAKRVVESDIPIFTTDDAENKALHDIGVIGLNRKTVGEYLERLGAVKTENQQQTPSAAVVQEPVLKYSAKSHTPERIPLWKRNPSS